MQKSRRHSYTEHLRDWYFVIFYFLLYCNLDGLIAHFGNDNRFWHGLRCCAINSLGSTQLLAVYCIEAYSLVIVETRERHDTVVWSNDDTTSGCLIDIGGVVLQIGFHPIEGCSSLVKFSQPRDVVPRWNSVPCVLRSPIVWTMCGHKSLIIIPISSDFLLQNRYNPTLHWIFLLYKGEAFHFIYLSVVY